MGLWHPDTIDGPIAEQIAACPYCEPDRRPRMLVCAYHEGWIAAIEGLHVAEHVHIHFRPDDTYDVTPMLPVSHVTKCLVDGGVYTSMAKNLPLDSGPCSRSMRGDVDCRWTCAWVDEVPRDPDVLTFDSDDPADIARWLLDDPTYEVPHD